MDPVLLPGSEETKDILAGIPSVEEGKKNGKVLVSPSGRFVAYLDFVPGAGLTNVEVPHAIRSIVRTTGVITIRDTGLGREWRITPEEVAGPLLPHIPDDLPVTFFVYPYFSKWIEDETEVWGTVELHDPADPSFPLRIEVFRIDVSDIEADPSKGELTIQFFPILHSGWAFAIAPEMLNPDSKVVLVEETNPEEGIVLALYLLKLDSPVKTLQRATMGKFAR
jgi:hypothetical protein